MYRNRYIQKLSSQKFEPFEIFCVMDPGVWCGLRHCPLWVCQWLEDTLETIGDGLDVYTRGNMLARNRNGQRRRQSATCKLLTTTKSSAVARSCKLRHEGAALSTADRQIGWEECLQNHRDLCRRLTLHLNSVTRGGLALARCSLGR